ncbi:MAG: DUF2142 domain-containing protein [Acidimicrobiales bacterium]
MTVLGWGLATPLMAAPDETTQMAQAAAVVRGQFDVPHELTATGSFSYVRVPAWIQEAYFLPNCFVFQPSHSAACGVTVGTGDAPVTVRTQFSNYPPLYFLWVGIPTLVLSGKGAIYAMRFASGLVDTSLLALGIYLLLRHHPRRLPIVGALVAITPMVLFLSAVINASGLEISAAFACWCAGLCMIEQSEVPRSLSVWTAVAFAIFISSRPLSAVNATVVLVILAMMAGWSRIRTIARDAGTQVIAAVIVTATVVAGVLLLLGGPPVLLGSPMRPSLHLTGAVRLLLRGEPALLQQAVGRFGWLDTPIPGWVAVAWVVMVAGLCVFGLATCGRCRRALPVLILAVLILPIVFEVPKINAVGPYWQGRYSLPLLVGIPLVAAAGRPRRPHSKPRFQLAPRLVSAARVLGMAALAFLVAWSQVATFVLALHRYTTGLGVVPGTRVSWTPPGGILLAIAVFVSGEVLLVTSVGFQVLRPSRHGTPARAPGAH